MKEATPTRRGTYAEGGTEATARLLPTPKPTPTRPKMLKPSNRLQRKDGPPTVEGSLRRVVSSSPKSSGATLSEETKIAAEMTRVKVNSVLAGRAPTEMPRRRRSPDGLMDRTGGTRS